MKKNIAVLGLGNPLMADEGIGCFLIQQFQSKADEYPLVDFIDAGTGGMNILHLIEDRHKVILIDCAYMGTKPGTIKRFTPDKVSTVKKLAHQSLHEADILKILALAKQLDQCPDEIIIFGIEPESIKLEQKLSDTLIKKLDDYIACITKELI
jgi:hydrogenase maturation protease